MAFDRLIHSERWARKSCVSPSSDSVLPFRCLDGDMFIVQAPTATDSDISSVPLALALALTLDLNSYQLVATSSLAHFPPPLLPTLHHLAAPVQSLVSCFFVVFLPLLHLCQSGLGVPPSLSSANASFASSLKDSLSSSLSCTCDSVRIRCRVRLSYTDLVQQCLKSGHFSFQPTNLVLQILLLVSKLLQVAPDMVVDVFYTLCGFLEQVWSFYVFMSPALSALPLHIELLLDRPQLGSRHVQSFP